MHQPRSNFIHITAAAAVGLVTPLLADVKTAEYTSDDDFEYVVKKMPDLDQVREEGFGSIGVPGGGQAYCVPTATTNALGYAAKHGFHDVEPGIGPYEQFSGDFYNELSLSLEDLGELMGTTPDGGTNNDGWINGLAFRLGAQSDLTIQQFAAAGLFSPQLPLMAQHAIDGGIVVFAYGRYDVIGQYLTYPRIQRDGGHAITMVEARAFNGVEQIGFRNPSSTPASDSPWSQSDFATSFNPVKNYLFAIGDADVPPVRGMAIFNKGYSDGRVRIIDSFIVLKPKFGLAFSPREIYRVNPILMEGMIGDTFAVFEPEVDPPILDLQMHPNGIDLLVLHDRGAEQAETLYVYDVVSRRSTALLELPGAKRVAVGRHEGVYSYANGVLLCHDVGSREQTASAPTANVTAIGYDDATDEVIVLSVPDREIRRFPAKLDGPPRVLAIPPSHGMSDDARFGIDPTYGAICVASSADSTIHCYRLGAEGGLEYEGIPFPGATSVASPSFDDAGHLFVSVDEAVKELAMHEDGTWTEVADSPFRGVVAPNGFQVSRSRTNFDPDLHLGPEWRHIPSDELLDPADVTVLDCDEDLNDDGEVGFGDVLVILGAWGRCPDSGPCLADLDESDAVDFADLIAVLSSWGACP